MQKIKGDDLKGVIEGQFKKAFSGAEKVTSCFFDFVRKDGFDGDTALMHVFFEEDGVEKSDKLTLDEMACMVSQEKDVPFFSVNPIFSERGAVHVGKESCLVDVFEGFEI